MTTTNEIANEIATDHGLTKVQGKTIVEAVFAAVTAAAASGAETSIPGFGKFKVRDTPEREAHNPAIGATIEEADLHADESTERRVEQVIRQE